MIYLLSRLFSFLRTELLLSVDLDLLSRQSDLVEILAGLLDRDLRLFSFDLCFLSTDLDLDLLECRFRWTGLLESERFLCFTGLLDSDLFLPFGLLESDRLRLSLSLLRFLDFSFGGGLLFDVFFLVSLSSSDTISTPFLTNVL